MLGDSVAASYSTRHPGDSTWRWITITRTMDAGSTLTRATCRTASGTNTAYFDGAILVEGDSCPAFSEKPPDEYHASGHEDGGADEISVADLSGELADVQPHEYNTMFANVQITGGGVITWGGSHLLWTTRLIAIPVEKTEFSSDGFINMDCPTSGTVVYYPEGGGTSTVACTADGIPIDAWEALYYRFVRGSASGSDRTRFCVVHYKSADWSPDDGWILLATRNGDATCESVKVAVGVTFPVTGGVYDVDAVLSDWIASAAALATHAALPNVHQPPLTQGFNLSGTTLQLDNTAPGLKKAWIPSGYHIEFENSTGETRYTAN